MLVLISLAASLIALIVNIWVYMAIRAMGNEILEGRDNG